MKSVVRSLVVSAAILTFSFSAFAQDNSVFIGGSFTHNGDLPKTFPGSIAAVKSGNNIGGADLGFSAKLIGPLGLALDLNYSKSSTQNQFLFAGGPELSIRPGSNRLFAHALVGGAYQTQKIKGLHLTALADSSFAYELGGGWEHFLGKHVGLRGGVDYIYTEAFGNEHNLRATAGIVFKL